MDSFPIRRFFLKIPVAFPRYIDVVNFTFTALNHLHCYWTAHNLNSWIGYVIASVIFYQNSLAPIVGQVVFFILKSIFTLIL